jgi:hypothetical protein
MFFYPMKAKKRGGLMRPPTACRFCRHRQRWPAPPRTHRPKRAHRQRR